MNKTCNGEKEVWGEEKKKGDKRYRYTLKGTWEYSFLSDLLRSSTVYVITNGRGCTLFKA